MGIFVQFSFPKIFTLSFLHVPLPEPSVHMKIYYLIQNSWYQTCSKYDSLKIARCHNYQYKSLAAPILKGKGLDVKTGFLKMSFRFPKRIVLSTELKLFFKVHQRFYDGQNYTRDICARVILWSLVDAPYLRLSRFWNLHQMSFDPNIRHVADKVRHGYKRLRCIIETVQIKSFSVI